LSDIDLQLTNGSSITEDVITDISCEQFNTTIHTLKENNEHEDNISSNFLRDPSCDYLQTNRKLERIEEETSSYCDDSSIKNDVNVTSDTAGSKPDDVHHGESLLSNTSQDEDSEQDSIFDEFMDKTTNMRIISFKKKISLLELTVDNLRKQNLFIVSSDIKQSCFLL